MPDDGQETVAVRSGHELDAAALDTYLRTAHPSLGTVISLSQFSHGQSNPTYRVQCSSGVSLVLRKKPNGVLIPTAHAVEREFRVLVALTLHNRTAHEAGCRVPVPRPLSLCLDSDTVGTPFYLMEFVEGRILTDPALSELRSASEREGAYRSAIGALAALHSVDVASVGLSDFGPTTSYYLRQVRRLGRVSAHQALHAPALPELLAVTTWLAEHAPHEAVSLIHGDYKMDNIVFSSSSSNDSPPRVLAILDWELSTLGHPLADLMNFCGVYSIPYNKVSDGGMRGLAGGDVELGWARNGVPAEEEVIALYCGLTRRNLDEEMRLWPYHKAFWFFKYATIAQGVAARAAQGVASSVHAVRVGAMAPLIMGMAMATIQECVSSGGGGGGRGGGGGLVAHPHPRL